MQITIDPASGTAVLVAFNDKFRANVSFFGLSFVATTAAAAVAVPAYFLLLLLLLLLLMMVCVRRGRMT